MTTERKRRTTKPVEERLAERISMPDGPHGCWIWTGTLDRKGYGQMHHEGRMRRCHRVSFESFTRERLTSDVDVCHRCDTPACVNPAHLFKGSRKDNMIDAQNKGRLKGWHVSQCKRGHNYNPENTYTTPSGRRHCRACRSAWDKAKKERLKHARRGN